MMEYYLRQFSGHYVSRNVKYNNRTFIRLATEHYIYAQKERKKEKTRQEPTQSLQNVSLRYRSFPVQILSLSIL